MTKEQQNALDDVIDSLVPDLKPVVAGIEASVATTQNHYGRYGALLTSIAPSKSKAGIVALALVKAGANRQGVASALECFY